MSQEEIAQAVISNGVASFDATWGFFQSDPPSTISLRSTPPTPAAISVSVQFPLTSSVDRMQAGAVAWLDQQGLYYGDNSALNQTLYGEMVQSLADLGLQPGQVGSVYQVVVEYQDNSLTIQALTTLSGGSSDDDDTTLYMVFTMLEQITNTQPNTPSQPDAQVRRAQGGSGSGSSAAARAAVEGVGTDVDTVQIAIAAFNSPWSFNGPYDGVALCRGQVPPALLSCSVQALPPSNPGDLESIIGTAVQWLCQQGLYYGANAVITRKLFSPVIATMAAGITAATPTKASTRPILEFDAQQVVAHTVVAGVLDITEGSAGADPTYRLQFAFAIVETKAETAPAVAQQTATLGRPAAVGRRPAVRAVGSSATVTAGYSLVNFLPTPLKFLHSDELNSVSGSPAYGRHAFTNHYRVVPIPNRPVPIRSVLALGSLYNSVDPITLKYTNDAWLPANGSTVYLRQVPEPQDTAAHDPCKYIAAYLGSQPATIAHLWGRGLEHTTPAPPPQVSSASSSSSSTSPSSSSGPAGKKRKK